MNRTWLFLFSIGILLPLRWLPNAMSKPSSLALPLLTTAAMITCGELVLNNPTVSPGGPFCPGDVVDITFTGSNLPEGENIEVFIDNSSTYNPFNGEGTSIGSIPIAYSCSTCPSMLGLLANACLTEQENEFMLLHSGCGFDVSDLHLDLLPSGSSTNDMGYGTSCPWAQPSGTTMSNLQMGTDCSSVNVIAAGDGDAIPPGAIVIAFMTNTGPVVNYDISDLCALGLPIYVIQNSCALTTGAFANNCTTPRVYAIDIAGSCSDNITYGCPPPNPGSTGSLFVFEDGSYHTSSNCDDPPFSSISYPDVTNDLASLSYTIPADICGGSNGSMDFYISGMVDITGPCEDIIYTAPSALSMEILCPVTIDPAGPFCPDDPPVQLTVTGSNNPGTWSGGAYITSDGIFDPSLASDGNNTVTYTEAPCGSVSATIVVSGPVISTPTSLYFFASATTCAGDSSGNIVNASFTTGGTMPYTYDWDAQDTPFNDVYTDDGNTFYAHGLNGVPAGWYDFIVTDANGCADTVSIEVTEGDPVTAVIEIDSIDCFGESTGEIDIVSSDGPPVPPVYNWDNIDIPGDEDFGGDPAVDDDMEDISGLPAGNYAITITYEDPGFFVCQFIDTIALVEPPELTVSVPDSLLPCFGNTIDITATPGGGTPPYSYNWSNIGGSPDPQTITGVGVGTYIVTVTDANGCTNSAVSVVTQPNELTANATGETIDCDDNTGDITLVLMGGTGPFQFDWDNDGTGDNDDPQNLSGLNSGTYSVTVTDANGCTAVATADIDLNPPTFTLPPDDGSTVPCISDAQVPPTPPTVVNSCGDPVNMSGPNISPDPSCSGTKTYTYTYTDPATGIMMDWVYTYTISPPTFVPPADDGSTVACVADAQTEPTPPTVLNSCGDPLVFTGPTVGADPTCFGVKIYTWDYEDCTGSTGQWTYTYTISAPVVTMPPGGSSTVDCNSDATEPTPPTVMDNCGRNLVSSSGVGGADPTCGGTKTWTFTYTACDGTTYPWVYTYTINAPTITMPPDGSSTVDCPADAVEPTPPTVTDNCGNSISPGPAVEGADPACDGTKTWTFTYTGCDGTMYDWVYTYTINAPTVSLPPAGSSTVDCPSDAVEPTPPTVMDNCNRTITPGPAVEGADPACDGTKTWTFTYTACDGATYDWVYTYTINAPTVTLPPGGSSTVDCPSDAIEPTPPTVMDNCNRTITPGPGVDSPDPACGGIKTWTFTYTACDGATYDWVYTYTINPTTFSLPPGGSSTVDCPADAVEPTPPSVVDDCGTPIIPGPAVEGADPACDGTKTWTFTYTGCDGSPVDWVYTYTINPPTVTLPPGGSSTVDCPADAVEPTPPSVMDNCNRTITPGPAVEGADPACGGTKTWTFTYTACDGATYDWVYTYTINPPTVTLPPGGSSTVDCPADAVEPTPPTVMDNCGNTLSPGPAVEGADPACDGTKTWTFTYTGCDGSTYDWVYTYTINPPTVTLPPAGSSTVDCPADAVEPTPPTVMDNCNRTITPGPAVEGADPACDGTKTWTFTYTACDGATYDWVYTYTINAPTVTLPPGGSSTVDCPSDAVEPTPPTVMDNCNRTLTPGPGVDSPDPACGGIKTWTFTYTACDGATYDWVYTYTINPTTFTLPPDGASTVDCPADAVEPTPPTVVDDCGTPVIPAPAVEGADPACDGTKTWTFTYTGCDGSPLDWVYTYTINPPTVTLPPGGSSTVDCPADAVEPTPPAVMDNCNRTITPGPAVEGADPACGGPKTWTFTYTACDGSTYDWIYTYTINPPTVTLPPGGSSTVDCPADAVEPTPPSVMDNCGNTLSPGPAVEGADPACDGTKTWTFTYTGCDGSTYDWVYTYTINPPTVTLPPGGSSTVDCPADAVEPTPPTVMDNCNRTITPGPAVEGADPACDGTKTWTFTYTACDGSTYDWVYTYTINPPTVTLPPGGSSTVDCPSDAVEPTPPTVMDNCNRTLTPGPGVDSPDPACGGIKTWTFTYTACDGATYDWVYTYTINPTTFTLPPDGASTVDCPADAVEPTPPTVVDDCGTPVTPAPAVEGADPACDGTKTWTFTYTGCDGSPLDWVYTYTINPPTVTLPPGGSSTVDCPSDAVEPTPPAVMDNCNRPLTPGPAVEGADPACGGPKTWTFTYTACDGSTYDWVYTYTINPPTVTLPPDGSSTVDCPADAVEPTPPTVMDNCGNTLTPGPAVEGADPACDGMKTWTFTYTACDGSTYHWVYTYAINTPTVSLPPGGSSTVDCPADAVEPIPPAVMDNCNRTLTPGPAVEGADPACDGTKTWTFTYTACDGATYDWIYTYTINPPTVTLPPGGSSTVDCPVDAVEPTPPTVMDNCNRTLTPGPGVDSPDPACGGIKTWTFTYTACDGATYDWVYTYTINPTTFTLPPDGSSTVDCPADAVEPTPPTVVDDCGTPVTPAPAVEGADPACDGTKTWTFTYTGCDGSPVDWVYTYTINPPTVTLPPGGSSTVDCPVDAVEPTPPAVMDNCNRTLTPGPAVEGADPACGGPKTWTFTYTACDGSTYDWVYTYTINPPSVTLPPGGSSTVDCPADAVEPTPPAVMDNCGNTLSPGPAVEGADPACGGPKTWTFTYTACDGSTYDWVYTYTINPPTVTLPPGGSSTVDCPADAVEPTPPAVMDNCGNPLTPGPAVEGADPACDGTKTWTFTYTACDGATYDWVYTYTINTPTITLPPGGSSTVDCPVDAVEPTPPTVMDNCNRTLTPGPGVDSPDPACGGIKTWTFTYTACDGSTYDWVYTYTINPTTFTLPPDGSSTVDCPADAIEPTPPTVVDDCGTPVIPAPAVEGADPACDGTKTWTFTYTGCDGVPVDWVYTYTINPPTVTLPPGGSSTVDCPADAEEPTPPAVMDNCNRILTPGAAVEGADPACGGPKTWTFTYTACDGATYDWVYTYTINPPTVTLPPGGSSTVDCPSDAVEPTPPSVTDNCGNTLAPGPAVEGADPACGGPKTWTFTYTACDGSTYDWVYTYTINPPTVTLPPGGSSTVDCPADAVEPTPPSIMDNCGNTLSPGSAVEGADPACDGPKTWTFTYTTCDGSTFDWVYTYTINPPTVTLPPGGSSTVDCPSDAVEPVPPTVMDNCNRTLTPSAGVDSPDPACGGPKTWTFTYTTCDGSTYDWVYTYTINPATFSLPAPGASTVDCIADAIEPTPPAVTDDCGTPIIPGPAIEGTDPVCDGVKTWTFTYTGCDGSPADWVYTYTISPPTFTMPADDGSTVDCIADAQVEPVPPVVNNSCGDPLTMTGPTIGPDPVCSGDKTYTWEYTDCTGSTGQWVYTYTVNPPTITLPADDGSTVDCITDAQVEPVPPIVNNSCGDPLTMTGPTIGPDPVCSGDKTYTWDYTDCTGATGQWTYTYTVNPPTATLPADGNSTVDCIADAQVEPVPPVVNNSCGDPLMMSGPTIGPDPVCSGDKTYTWDYTDCTGSTLQWVYTYTVNPPTFTMPPDDGSTVVCIADAQVEPVPPVVNNSCGDPLMMSGPTIGPDPVCSGDKTYTWDYTDCTGNTAQWVYTYTVNPPTFTLPPDDGSTVACISDAQVEPTPPTVINSCGDPEIPTGPTIGPDPVCSGDKTYTWDYTDCSGSTLQWVYTYTVDPPTFTMPADDGSTVACITDAQVEPTPPAVNNSCGDPLMMTGPTIGSDPVCTGTKTYTWEYEDCTGTTGQWVYTYTIDPPTFTLPPDDGSTVPCVSDAQVEPVPPVVNNSCGDPLMMSGPTISSDPVCSGTKTYTWDYTDCTGASGQWVYTYTVEPPTISLPADDGSTVACISDAQIEPTPPVVNNSCGDPLTMSGPVVGPDPVCSGDKTYTWTYTDCTGATGDWVYTYTVDPPIATMPPDGSSTVACISDAQTEPVPPVVNNSCGDPLVITGPTVGPDPICSGDKTYTWDYTDCTGAVAQWVYTYTVEPPTFTLPPDDGSTVPCVSDAQVEPVPPTVDDSCGNPITPSGPTVGSDPLCQGDKTYTWDYTDCNGNTLQWVYTYTVLPNVFTLPADEGSTVPCIADAQVEPVPPVVTNSCGDPVVPTGPDVSPDPSCDGTKTYTWTFTDCAGNSLPWVYTYTITPPAFTLPADDGSTVACITDAQVEPVPPAATNSCGDPLTMTGPTVGPDPVCSGDKTYTWEYMDCTGATEQWVYTYTVDPPTFTMPADDGSTVDCVSDAQVEPVPPVVNNSCGDPLTPSGPVIGSDPVCSGDKTFTWTYTDCTGATADWVYTYTVSPPTLSLPGDDGSTVDCISDAQVEPVPPTVNNSCGEPLMMSGPIIGADPVCSGDKTYTWTYTDCTGASADWVYTYTVSPPTITLPPDDGSTVDCISDAQTEPIPPTVNNSCGDPLTMSGPVIGSDPVCSGDKTYTWTYTDCTGASADWVYTYTIADPSFSLPADDGSTVPCIADAQVEPIPPVVNSSCGDPIVPTGPVISPDPACDGIKTFIWTYTDCAGMSQEWTYTYTITGDTGPVFETPPADITVDCVGDVPPMISLNYTNDCSPDGSVMGTDSDISGSCPATIVRTWSFTDPCGNTSSVSQNITIDDTTPPTATDPSPIIVGPCNDPVPAPDLSVVTDAADNCSVPVVAFAGDETELVGCTETTTRSFTVTDACNNSITVTQFITRNVDTTPPVFTDPPSDLAIDCISQLPPMEPLDYTDNCSDPGTVIGMETGPSGDPLTITREWTVTDDCGNTATATQIITISGSTESIDITENICDGDTVILYGEIYDAPGMYVDTLPGIGMECDTVVNIEIILDPLVDLAITESYCFGDSVQVYGIWYSVPGTYLDTIPTITTGCDTALVLTINEDPLIDDSKSANYCYGDSVQVNGEWYSAPGVYLDTVPSTTGGCDTALVLTIIEDPLVDDTQSTSYCYGDSVQVGGVWYSSPGTYNDTIPSTTGGCDTALLIMITEDPLIDDTQSGSYCYGDSVQVGGVWYSSPGTYNDTIPSTTGGCDTALVVMITEDPLIDDTQSASYCYGDSVQVGGIWYSSPGTFMDTIPSTTGGCDTALVIMITEESLIDDTQIASYCYGDSVQVGGVWYSSPGTYMDTIPSTTGGCDTALVIMITEESLIDDTESASYCVGDSVQVGGVWYSSPGTFMDTIPSTTGGCDTALVIMITEDPLIDHMLSVSYCFGDSVQVGGEWYSSPGTFMDTIPSTTGGCDTALVLMVTEEDLVENDVNATFCSGGSVIVFGEEYDAAGIYFDTIPSTTGGCDTAYTIIIDEQSLIENDISETICANGTVTIYGMEYDMAGTYLDTVPSTTGGCDTAVTILITEEPLIDLEVDDSFCTGGSVTIYGVEYDMAGTYLDTVPSTTGGCDTAVVINITEEGLIPLDIDYTGCEGDGYSVTVNGTVYDETNPTGTETIPGQGTCDTLATIDLVFEPFTEAEITPVGPLCLSAGATTLVAVPSGGTWSGDVSDDQFDPADYGTGVFEVIYTTAPGNCESADTIYITVYELTISCEAVDQETAPGANDGSGQVTISGGVPPYTISWTGPVSGSTTENADGTYPISSLTAGVYTIEVEDAEGCVATCEFTVTGIPPCDLTIDAVVPQDATCPGVDDGSITITASSTMPPIEYSLDGVDYFPGNVFNLLAPGSYTIFVRDAAGCEDMTTVDVGVGDGPELTLESVEDAFCGLDNGEIRVSASGGSIPYTYSIDGIDYGLTPWFPGLPPGSYLIYLIDDVGCTDTLPVDVGSSEAPMITEIIIGSSSCGQSDGSITVIAEGGLGDLEYSIDGVNYQSSNVFNSLPAGTYTVYVRDESGCQVTEDATILDLGGPEINSVVVTPTSCGDFDGTATIDATGEPVLMYSIDGSSQTSNLFENLSAGNYIVTVTDGNGCSITEPFTVNTTDGPIIDDIVATPTTCGEDNGTISITATPNPDDYEYFLNDVSYGSEYFITDLPAGIYEIVVEDENECTASGTVTVEPSVTPDFDVYITPAHCGQADGIIELDGTEGQPPFTYSIDNGPFSPTFVFVNKPSEFYTVAIMDANGCIYEEDVFLWEDEGVEIEEVIATDPACGETTGTIEIIAEPEDNDNVFSITIPTSFQSSNVFQNVNPGTYLTTVKDEFGCTDTASVTIVATPSPVISALFVNTECGDSTGSITVSASLGVEPYMYSIDNGPFGTNNVFSDLPAGIYFMQVLAANGCIDTVSVEIISEGTQYEDLADAICEGDEYILEGETFTEAGMYEVSVPGGASDGCDSIVRLTLTVDPFIPKEIKDTICVGDVYTYNGTDYTSEGVYPLDTIPATMGCDTLLSLALTVNPLDTTYLDETICYNGVYTINGEDYTMTGEYPIDTIPGTIGCDSVRILRLVVEDLDEVTLIESICEGEVYSINGMDYSVTGMYVVDTVPGPGGCDTILNLDLTVHPLPSADAGADMTLDCAMQTVTLNGDVTGGLPLWTGPDIDATNENEISPEVSQPGLYILTVTSGENCTDIDSVLVDQDPDVVIANAGLDDSLSCNVTEITLQASPVGDDYIYQWTGPGINGTNENLPNPVIDVEGTYTLVVTDTVTGCVSAPDDVVISDISVVLIAIIQDPDDLTCYIDSVDLEAVGSSTGPNIVYAWFDADGELVSTSPGFEITSGGLFVLVVQDTVSGCFDNDSVFVNDLTRYPEVEAGLPQDIDCNNATALLNEGATNNNPNIIFEWTGPPGGIIGADSLITALVGEPGEYFLSALDTVTGCENSDSVLVNDMTTLPDAEIAVIEPITCIDETATLDIGGSSTGADIDYIWSGPDISNYMAESLETSVPGEYYLDVINGATGCASRDTILLEVPEVPSAMLVDIMIPLCAGDASGSITVTDVVGGTPPYMYSMDGGPLQSSPVFEDLFAGEYSVQVVDANGCSIAESYTMADGQELSIDIGPDIELVLGDSAVLWADISLPWDDIDSLVWTPNEILSCTHCTNPLVYGLNNATVTATVYSGGCLDQDMLQVRVDVDADIYIPNVFSPNDDGINDWVTIYTDHRVKRVVYFEIFDRWGNQVFVGTDFPPNDPLLGWDGYFKGKKMNPAVFAYTAQVELLNGSTIDRKGDITLVR